MKKSKAVTLLLSLLARVLCNWKQRLLKSKELSTCYLWSWTNFNGYTYWCGYGSTVLAVPLNKTLTCGDSWWARGRGARAGSRRCRGTRGARIAPVQTPTARSGSSRGSRGRAATWSSKARAADRYPPLPDNNYRYWIVTHHVTDSRDPEAT